MSKAGVGRQRVCGGHRGMCLVTARRIAVVLNTLAAQKKVAMMFSSRLVPRVGPRIGSSCEGMPCVVRAQDDPRSFLFLS